VTVIGAGLAGCEAACALARAGVSVRLIEQKPLRFSPAHRSANLAELVCSNSLKAERVTTAAGLLKQEMRRMGSVTLAAAESSRTPAGGALAVDRDLFSERVTQIVEEQPRITLERLEADGLPDGPVIVATGPLTQGKFAEVLKELCGGMLYFHDAAAPVVTASSLDPDLVTASARYGRGGDDYLNAYMDRAQYETFLEALLGAAAAPREDFDPLVVYEGCQPGEILAKKGRDTLRFGPLKPVGLTDPATGRRPWAAVQLRRENAEGTLYNLVGFQTGLRFSEQKRVFSLIPGLARAEFARYGVMHRNTYLDSPRLLDGSLRLRTRPDVRFAGQITGVEGYMESAACGIVAARMLLKEREGGQAQPPPRTTMTGALIRRLRGTGGAFQPQGAAMGLLPPLEQPVRDKEERRRQLSLRALRELEEYLCES